MSYLKTVLDFPLPLDAVDLFVNKARHERRLSYLIGFDFSLILWSEITMVYVEDVLKRLDEHSCFLTARFLNGLYSAVKNLHVREIKCIAAGDPYCEWEIV